MPACRHLATLFALCALSAATAWGHYLRPGSFVLTFKTQSYQGKFAPRHVLAVWLVDAKDRYVRDLAVYGEKCATRLSRWSKDSGKTKPDAVTGANLQVHEELSVVWDGTDAKGKLLPDGEYRVRIEYTEANQNGPVFQIPLQKGNETGTRKVRGNEFFTDVTVRRVGRHGDFGKK